MSTKFGDNIIASQMRAAVMYQCYVDDKGVKTFRVTKDRYGLSDGSRVYDEAEFNVMFQKYFMDDEMYKRFLKYLKKEEPEYVI